MFLRLAILITALSTSLFASKAAIISTAPAGSPAAHGIAVLTEALRAKGIETTASATGADYIIATEASVLAK